MRKLFLSLLILLPLSLMAQNKNATPPVIVENLDLNVLYRGYDNHFNITVPGVFNDKVKVSATGASVRMQGGLWIINPDSVARVVSLSVSAEINGKMMQIGTKQYRVKGLPIPKAFLTVKDRMYESGSDVPLSILTDKMAVIDADYGPDGLLQVPFKVSSFSTSIKGMRSVSKGNRFSEEQLAQIRRLASGSVILIKDIRATGPNGKTLLLAPVVLAIK